MSRSVIELLPLDNLPASYRASADMMNRLVGESTTIQVLAHSRPSVDFYFQDFYEQMFYNKRPGLKVDVQIKQLIRLRLSKRHGCALCNRANEEEVRALGFTEAQIDALFYIEPSRGAFTELELAVIDWADQMVLSNQNGRLDAILYARLRRYFSDEQIVEMAMVTAILVGATKMTFVLDIVPREASCSLEPRLAAAEQRMASAV
jgi:alkylhydroperoxidase family enzyme